jgi:hypothetical protein
MISDSMGETNGCALETESCLGLLMGIVTRVIISFALLALNLGFPETFAQIWLRSWGITYVVVVPAILLIGPALQAQIGCLIQ